MTRPDVSAMSQRDQQRGEQLGRAARDVRLLLPWVRELERQLADARRAYRCLREEVGEVDGAQYWDAQAGYRERVRA